MGEAASPRLRIKGLEYISSSELVKHPKNWRRHGGEQSELFRRMVA